MADQNFIPPNLPLEEKKTGPASLTGPVSPPTISSSGPIDRPHTPTIPSRPVKTYIRTMDADINALRSGQVPRGVEKTLPLISATARPAPSSSVAPPAKSSPVVEIKLSKPEQKTVSLPPSPKEEVKITINAPKPTTPQIIVPSILTAPKITPEPPPQKPLSIPAPKPESKPTMVVPPPPSKKGMAVPAIQSRGFRGSKMLLPAIATILLIIAGLGYWFFALRDRGKVNVTISPSPSSTATNLTQPTLRVSKLSSFFPAYYLLPIKKGEGKTLTSVLPEIERSNVLDPSKNILLDARSEDGEDYTFSAFLNRFLINFPANLVSVVDEKDFDLIWSAQKELFNAQGKEVSSNFSTEERRLSLAVRVTDAEQVRKTMLEWEASMADDWQNFFTFPASSDQFAFSPASHRNVAVRYMNFPTPDYSIDYGVITAKNNDDYLVISNSREQMFGIIDVLLGF